MNFKRAQLTELQRDLLTALLNQGMLRRCKGGYAAAPGAKPFTVRAVQMLERAGFLCLDAQRATVSITVTGSQLMLQGFVDLPEPERLAG